MRIRIDIDDPNMDALDTADMLKLISVQIIKATAHSGLAVLGSKVKDDEGYLVGSWLLEKSE